MKHINEFNFFKKSKFEPKESLYQKINMRQSIDYIYSHKSDHFLNEELTWLRQTFKGQLHHKDIFEISFSGSKINIEMHSRSKVKFVEIRKFKDEYFLLEIATDKKLIEERMYNEYYLCDTFDGLKQILSK